MYQSKIPLLYRTTTENKKRVQKAIMQNPLCRSGKLKRKVSLVKYMETNQSRQNASLRFQSFFTGLDIVKKSKEWKEEIIDGYVCFSSQGLAKNGELVSVHIREEVSQKKDKTLYLMSTFYPKK